MADPVEVPPVAPVAEAPAAVAAAPAPVDSGAAPAAPAADAPVVAATEAPPAVAAEAPVVEAPKAEGTDGKLVSEVPSLLETIDKPKDGDKPVEGDKKPEAEAKPAEGDKKPEEAKPVEAAKPVEGEAKPVEAPKVEPVEYKYTVPETVKLNDELKGELHTLLDDFRANPAENTQKLVDFHVARMEEFAAAYAQDLSRQQHETFNNTRKTWQTQLMADEVMGGNGWETTKTRVAQVRDRLLSSAPPGSDQYKREWAEANDFLRITGAGDHPAMWRMLNNAAKYVLETRATPSEIKPPKDIGKPPGSRTARLYDNTDFKK